MTAHDSAFSATYGDARRKLLDIAAHSNREHAAYNAPGTGVSGEALAIDVVRIGARLNQRTLLLTSACHGVEGFAGSAIQLALLTDLDLVRYLDRQGITVLIVHALNPYGFSWCRRVTKENVDLNRNAVDFEASLPANEAYEELHPHLVLPSWPPSDEHQQELTRLIGQWGMPRFQDALTRGQYSHADGLFFGGHAPTWSLRTFQMILRTWLPESTQLAWIDLHSGLGPAGVGEPIFTGGGGDNALALARLWWGEGVTRTDDGSSVSSDLSGTLPAAVRQILGRRLSSSITLEFGTVSPMQVLAAMRLDASANLLSPDRMSAIRNQAMKAMRDAFYVDTPEWRDAILTQGISAARSAIEGLASMHL